MSLNNPPCRETIPTPPQAIGIWLGLICTCIAVMVAIGGVTRLTGSGLSITDWRPLTGAVPPLSAADWQQEFEKYMGSPQHRLVFPDMTVEEFKGIYWWEWIHRFWGRLIGVLYAVPLAVFWIRGMVPHGWRKRLLLGLLLGGAQGVLGWFMVQSGLVDRPSVSAYRLAAHLGLAVLIFGLLWWWALDILRRHAIDTAAAAARPALTVFTALLALQVLYAGFMAGTKAAMAHPTFPKLGSSWLPAPAGWMEPAWRNLFENTSWIAFLHRWTGMALALGGGLLGAWLMAKSKTRAVRLAGQGLILLLGVQVLLGIATTLMSRGSIPVSLGTLHQSNALALLALALFLLHAAHPRSGLPDGPGWRK